MEQITRDELLAVLTSGADVRLVMAMGSLAYQAKRIPGSLNFGSPRDALASLDRDDDIVVYCSDRACHASAFAAEWLERNGYRHVRRYSGGLRDWEDGGLPLEGEAVTA